MSTPSTQTERTVRAWRAGSAFAAPLVLGLIAIVGFFVYPGHTFLESDSQIFMPVLLHRANPALFGQDILIKSVHTTYTIWDELALGIQRVTGLQIEPVLWCLQILLRFAGLLGVFWLLKTLLRGAFERQAENATSPPMPAASAAHWLALAGAAIYGMGAFVVGPSLQIIEAEPIPRAFSLPLVLLGLGLIGRGRLVAACIAGACAYLLHPPTSLAFWAVYLLAALVHTEDQKRWHGLALLPAAGVILQVFAWLEPLPVEVQEFFNRIDSSWEMLQRLRAPYVFPTGWHPSTFWVDACLVLLIALAYLRLRGSIEPRLRTFLWGLPLAGALSIPLTWLLLEKLRWSLMPQLQPMRYALYLSLFGIVLGYAAGMTAAVRQRRYAEAALWFMAAFSIGFLHLNLLWLTPLLVGSSVVSMGKARAPVAASDWMGLATGLPLAALIIWRRPFGFKVWEPANVKLLAVSAVFAVLLLLLVFVLRRMPRLVPLGAGALAIFLLVAAPAAGRNIPSDHRTRSMRELSAWAYHATPQNSVFLFADAGRGLEPGCFVIVRSAASLWTGRAGDRSTTSGCLATNGGSAGRRPWWAATQRPRSASIAGWGSISWCSRSFRPALPARWFTATPTTQWFP